MKTLPCSRCGGRARAQDAPCTAPGCDQGQVPACFGCEARPVSGLHAPFCGVECRDKWEAKWSQPIRL